MIPKGFILLEKIQRGQAIGDFPKNRLSTPSSKAKAQEMLGFYAETQP